MKPRHGFLPLLLLLGGCVTAPSPAPVSERQPAPAAPVVAPAPVRPKLAPGAPVPATYTVVKGDTLFGISKAFGLNFRDVATWNNLAEPAYTIKLDQVLTLRAPQVAAPPAKAAVETVSLKELPPPQATPLAEPPLKTEPRALKQPYSEAARAAMDPAARLPTVPTSAPAPASTPPAPAATQDDQVEWAWPTQGKVVATFLDTEQSKGIDISGQAGQAVVAAAPGHVEYSGGGLRAYGKLVIIRHNTTFMSVYAHNKELLVKQGDQVGRGQKIALMGEHESGEPRLHFEIRQLGRPADPMAFLPPKSNGTP
jgi:lipoprotein NlpD